MIVLHIGLPKTGTTFLQRNVFGPARDLAYVHRAGGRAEERLCLDLRRLGRVPDALAPFWRWRVARKLGRLRREGRRVLVSDENVSVLGDLFWRGQGARPEVVAVRLGALAAALPQAGPLKVIIGIRRQDHWLASRYAESSKHFAAFGQDDFDRRMAAIAAGAPLEGALRWLDYRAVRETFAAALGAENLLLLPLERIATEPAAVADETSRFVGGLELDASRVGRGKKGSRNRLSRGEDVWALRRDRTELRLVPELKVALNARFAASNRALGELLPLGFGA